MIVGGGIICAESSGNRTHPSIPNGVSDALFAVNCLQKLEACMYVRTYRYLCESLMINLINTDMNQD